MSDPCNSSEICILLDRRGSSATSGSPLSGFDLEMLHGKMRRAGLNPADVAVMTLAEFETGYQQHSFRVLVPLGERSLTATTGLKSLHKWHLSRCDTLPELQSRKSIPSFSPENIRIDWSLGLYLEMALRRAREESATVEYARKPKRFLLNPSLDDTFSVLDSLVEQDWLAVDIETGRGQINTVGFAWSESDAIAIGVLPDRCSSSQYLELWRRIARVCEGRSRKLMQNGIYETLYLSRYGIRIANFVHDTMVAQKFLWPELEKGLDNVGRLYTREPYWKDVGHTVATDGKRKDWGTVRDWPEHYRYNCLDTTGTYEAAFAQRQDLSARGKLDLHDNYLVRLFAPAAEMCLRGFPLCRETQARLVAEYEKKVATLTAGLSREINPRSPKQKQTLFRDKGYIIPRKHDRRTGFSRDSVDELSLKKLRLKYPDDPDIPILLEVSELEKALSSYLRVDTGTDVNVHFMLDPCGTETGRWSSSLDPWRRGFNAQTVPIYAKAMLRFS